jgi:hypothetical protein
MSARCLFACNLLQSSYTYIIPKNKSKQTFKINIPPSHYEVTVFLFATGANDK